MQPPISRLLNSSFFSLQTAAEYEKRRDKFFKEMDIVIADVVTTLYCSHLGSSIFSFMLWPFVLPTDTISL
jgi:hypothetical protein